MSDLIAFLNARLAEYEDAATPGRHALDDLRFELKSGDGYEQHLSSRIEDGLDIQTGAWQARVLRDVEADRKLIAAYERCAGDRGWDDALEFAVRCRAERFSDHPGYDEAWKP